jgi:hypothetical protein
METKDWDNYKSYEFIKNKVKHNHKVDEIEYFNLNGAGKINEKQNSNLSGGYGDQNKTNKQNSNLSGGYDKLSDTIWGFNEEPSWDNFYFDNYEDKIIKINDNNIEGIYGGDEKSHLINKIILGCDFIETIFIYESFIKNLERYDIEYWCYKNKLNYKQMLNVIAKRDEIIESLASCNFKINYNAPRLNHTLSDENLNYIQRIKNCIKAGYKNHTATWNVDKNNYIDDNKKINIKIIDNELIKYNPKHIVFNKKMYFAQEINKGIKQYSLMAKKICII